MQGGDVTDVLKCAAAISLNLKGGGAVDVFNINATLTGSVDGEAGGATLAGTQIVNATLTGPGVTLGDRKSVVEGKGVDLRGRRMNGTGARKVTGASEGSA